MSFLSVIVDCNAGSWADLLAAAADTEEEAHQGGGGGVPSTANFEHMVSAIVAFCNAHLLSSMANRLLVLAAGGVGGGQRNKKIFDSASGCESAVSLFFALLKIEFLKKKKFKQKNTETDFGLF